ncbi:pilus assembly protein FlpE [Cellulomonas wangsupingiae]|uniref:Pilus assembly protein FlpE n=1 Tax=Cellulomonas wangsupingiae TaxID=2968085 RepID=A0ABY5K1V3_9CELL|nr:pilus assembly protein FlpE [Cellulomonas wangsupingiae]MCC2335519.1 pilus assembly protein FlpE [Cellulomonas wangsupingiae]MCM0639951.1 pilus assembly protein FlpE [Cellulomonas wangsupingiae]UUI64310.1 pilus assembly protein FlpE [Cellulomonas wangsupingiae]
MERGRRALVVGVVGAAGGVGASTLAALLARHLSRTTSTVLVDLDRGAGGLDVVVGVEEVDGARWPDLRGAGGDVRGADVVALLPRWGSCAVLSADRTRPAPVDAGVRVDVLHALACEVGALVLDLDRGTVVDGDAPLAACDAVAVVARPDLRSVAGALALRPRLDEAATACGLVVQGGPRASLAAADVADASGLDVWHVARRDRALATRAERTGPGGRGPAARSAAAVARRLGLPA